MMLGPALAHAREFLIERAEPLPSRVESWLGAIAVAAMQALLAVSIVGNGTFFDDEIFSILNIEDIGFSATALWLGFNSYDVHPPLGYVLAARLWSLTGSAEGAKQATGLLGAVALAGFALLAARGTPRYGWWIMAAALALSGTAGMWLTSLRWYAWFAPIYWLAFAWLMWGRSGPVAGAIAIGAVGAVLFHINYVAVIAVPALLVPLAWRCRAEIDMRRAALMGLCMLPFLLLCVTQAIVLLNVHLASDMEQQGSIPFAASQVIMLVTTGTAIFPFHPLAIVYLLVLGAAAATLAVRKAIPAAAMPVLLLLAASGVPLALTGLGYRPRNELFLLAPAVWLAAMLVAGLQGRWRWTASAIMLVSAGLGYANAATRQDTTKRDFNRPYDQMVRQIERWNARCPGLIVLHGQQVLAYELRRRNIAQSGLLTAGDESVTLRPGACFVTYEDALQFSPEESERIFSQALDLDNTPIADAAFGHDPFAGIKSRIEGRAIADELALLRLWRFTGTRPASFRFE